MILKGSQRGGGANLAAHLSRLDENDHVCVHEMRGFTANTLKGAFKEAEAVSRATQCRQYLFSLSLNPPEGAKVAVPQFEEAIRRIEDRLGLTGQPRTIVFHEKEGRRHAHCVWSRIDAETMTAKPLSFFKTKLMDLARDLYREHGWDMPRGLADPKERSPLNFTLAEWHRAKRQGIDPRSLKAMVQECWSKSDTPNAFDTALQERGLWLARGDRRGAVVVDYTGDVHSLPRLLDLKTKDVRARLGDGSDLQPVDAVTAKIAERMTPAIRCTIAEAKKHFEPSARALYARRAAMTEAHREARTGLEERLQAEWRMETQTRASRLPRGIRGLWSRLTGQYRKIRNANEAEARDTLARYEKERQHMIEAQLEERAPLQMQIKELRQDQAERLLSLRKDLGRYLAFARPRYATRDRSQTRSFQRDYER